MTDYSLDELKNQLFWRRVIVNNIQDKLDEHPHYDAEYAAYLREQLMRNQAECEKLSAAINDIVPINAVAIYV